MKTGQAPAFDPDAPAAPGSGIFGLPFKPDDAQFVVVPVPWEVTTSYGGGTSKGPAAILAASAQVDLYDHETGRPYESGIAMLPIPKNVAAWNREGRALAAPIIRAGGADGNKKLQSALGKVNKMGDRLNAWVQETTAGFIARGKTPIVLGGDHSTPFGAIAAWADAVPGLGVLHFDAHADLRDAYEGFTWSHASIMFNVATRLPKVSRLVQVGLRDLSNAEARMIEGSGGRIRAFFDADMSRRVASGEPFARIAHEIVEALPERVYVSFDIDALDPTLCPHTGTPVPGGLSFQQATLILNTLARSGRRIVGGDLNEVAPGPRGDEWDANVGARLLYKLIGFTRLSRENR
jgi:agmatinase